LKSSSKKPELEFHFLTLFPEVFGPVLGASLLGKAQKRSLVRYRTHQIRDFSEDKHRTVDGTPYGGGEGMLLRADVLFRAWKKALPRKSPRARTLLLSPQGRPLTQARAKELVRDYRKLVLVCGHYEGVDERFIEKCVDEEISIGDYVLTGGELPALVVADVLTRLIPGVVGNGRSLTEDSLEGDLLKYPQYTRPKIFEGLGVPDVLLSGNHAKIAEWRQSERVRRTREKRPDLLKK
jgi:tRNA (guanine37-N1)-methyltransferase